MQMLFLDFETLGRNVYNSAIIDCSAVIVDTDRMLTDPYNLDSLSLIKRFKLSVKNQVDKYDWVVYKDTVQFWETVSDAAKKHIAPKKSDLTVEEFTAQFVAFLDASPKVDYWWTRSNTFDPVLLWRIFDSVNGYYTLNERLPYWRIRDMRTYIDAKLDFPKKNGFVPIKDEALWTKSFVEHDSSWDVLADVLRMQAIIRAESDLEQI